MRHTLSYHFYKLCIISLCLFLAVGCGNSSVDERQAQAIFEKAEQLQANGRTLEALQEFARLTEFRDSSFFKKAEATLLEEGISISDPLESWTIKLMTDTQNTLIRQGKERHPDGEITVPYNAQDAWGRSLVVEYSIGDKYSFVVVSAGKDKKFGSSDDLKIYNQYLPGERKAKLQHHEKNNAQSHESLSRQAKSDVTNVQSSKNDKNAEAVVNLTELLGK